MIQALSGVVYARKKQIVTLAIGPLMVDLAVADESQFALNSTLTVFTYLHWNQEQGPSLYGFSSEADRLVFTLIIGCSGIGPRIALSVLANLGAPAFIDAISKADERVLSKVSGIGPKKAEQMIVQLKHKVHDLLAAQALPMAQSAAIDWHTVSEALKALNYSRGEIAEAIAFIRDQHHEGIPSFDYVLRQALSFLSKQQ